MSAAVAEEMRRQEAAQQQAERQEAERKRQEAEVAQQDVVPADPAPGYTATQGGAGGYYQRDTTPYGTACGPGDRDGDGDGVCNAVEVMSASCCSVPYFTSVIRTTVPFALGGRTGVS